MLKPKFHNVAMIGSRDLRPIHLTRFLTSLSHCLVLDQILEYDHCCLYKSKLLAYLHGLRIHTNGVMMDDNFVHIIIFSASANRDILPALE